MKSSLILKLLTDYVLPCRQLILLVDPVAIGWSGNQQRRSEIIFLQLPVFLSAVRDQQKFFNIKDCDLAAGCF